MGAATRIPALHAINPDMQILVATGYAPDEIQQRLDNLTIAGYIQKPFAKANLAAAVRAAIDGHAPAGPLIETVRDGPPRGRP